ncbi:aquaporin [Candidatus Saccharibacteria bacterium]|nr:aquaporin [Candidatus Saccharibacteria bacterium]MBH2007236.1 aquaporin [Candidatus Saccharibacteria bacterium]
MATKKTASAKKSSTTAAKQTKTKVTTVKAVAADATPKVPSRKLQSKGLLQGRSVILGAFIAEFIGTFILASVAVHSQGQPLYVGFALIAIVLTVGTLSGSHVNPLVTVGAWATRKITGLRALGYVISQVLGALLAFVVASTYANAAPEVSQQAQMLGQQSVALFSANPVPDGKEFYVFFAELLGATIFGLAVSSAIRERRNRAAQAFTVGLGLFTALVISGVAASYIGGSSVLNPAIAFTLQAVQFNSSDWLWPVLIYIVSPLIGGTIGFFLYDVLRGESDGGDDKLIDDVL